MACAASGQHPVSWDEWLLPNFSSRLTVEVRNPQARPLRALATISVQKAQAVAPNFPGTLAIALEVKRAGGDFGASVIPCQADDLDADGTPDQFEMAVELNAHQSKRVDVYYSTTLHDRIEYPKRVQAKHNYGYNFQTAALESEVIGYRTYGAFFLDVQARRAGHPGLNNDLAGYLAMRMEFDSGRDIFHAGDTLGLGGIFLRRDGQVYRPPFNVPDYAHKPSPEMVPHYRVISDGPLRAIVEAKLDRWTVGEDEVRLRAVYSIDAGEGFVRCHVEVSPVRVAPGHVYEVGAGVRDLPNGSSRAKQGLLLATGTQERRIGPVALAVYYDPAAFQGADPLRLKEAANQVVVLQERFAAGRAVEGDYALAAAWSGSGIADLPGYLAGLAAEVNTRVEAGGFIFDRTPRPERLDAESQ